MSAFCSLCLRATLEALTLPASEGLAFASPASIRAMLASCDAPVRGGGWGAGVGRAAGGREGREVGWGAGEGGRGGAESAGVWPGWGTPCGASVRCVGFGETEADNYTRTLENAVYALPLIRYSDDE